MSKYTESQRKFREENLKLWEEKLLEIFNNRIPKHCEWSEITQIDSILNIIGKQSLNHMLYPDSGGLDVVGCNISVTKRDILEILTDGSAPNICKPKQLIFDCIDGEPEWSYFRLELNKLEPSGVYSSENEFVEELYEDNGHYEPYSDYPPNDYWRHILRILGGTLLIVPKTCYYNHIPNTYLGTHNKYGYMNFREMMEKLKMSEGYAEFLKEMQ